VRVALSILGYGVLAGLAIASLRFAEYRLLVVDHAVELYAGLIAAGFAALGIWLGRSLARRGRAAAGEPEAAPAAPPPAAFAPDEARRRQLGITPRELEILGWIAAGLSNREIAERLFVAESTVKTHSSRLFDKLGAKRRTQAVQIGKSLHLIA
jgi:ATP/maltotriose-dependent transcriptional regulator MalT